jgi:hypothetical protein
LIADEPLAAQLKALIYMYVSNIGGEANNCPAGRESPESSLD